VINKTDLAPYVGASLEVMERDTNRMRGERPWTFTNLKAGDGLATIIAFLEEKGMLRIKKAGITPAVIVIYSCYWQTLLAPCAPLAAGSRRFLPRVDIPLVEPNFTVVRHFVHRVG
jgi:hypothetical protein